jgi:hypothetical protein
MFHQKFYGPHENFWGWRYICCGDIIDQIILENKGSIAVLDCSGGEEGAAMIRSSADPRKEGLVHRGKGISRNRGHVCTVS